MMIRTIKSVDSFMSSFKCKSCVVHRRYILIYVIPSADGESMSVVTVKVIEMHSYRIAVVSHKYTRNIIVCWHSQLCFVNSLYLAGVQIERFIASYGIQRERRIATTIFLVLD